ncbi:MAG: cache domain-containing protein, partial [Bacteroidales bacterium]
MKRILNKSRVKFFANIVLPSILAVILFIVTFFFIVIPHFENAMMDRKREMITELTNAAVSILAKYHKDEQQGRLTREEAQETAISRIEYLRYGEENKDYFWITDMQPVMIVHPYKPELNGKNLQNYTDPEGKKLFVEFVKAVEEQDHGYVEYMWQWKDDSTRIVPKLSCVQKFEPWNWIVGTGIYIEDVKKEIAALTQTFTRISILISVIVILILFWISRQSFRIESKRRRAEKQLNQSREKYRSLVEASTEGLLIYMDNTISFANPVFENISGLSARELATKNITELLLIPEDIQEKMQKGDFNFQQVSLESKIYKENESCDVILNIMPLKIYGKDAIVFSVKDMSSDKMIKEELAFNKEKFQNLMDKLNQGIFRTSLDPKGKFLEANQTALRILGYKSFAELQDKYIIDLLVDEEDKRSFRNNLLEYGFLKNKILKLRKKKGEHTIVSVSLVVIYDDHGNPRFCDGIINDVDNQSQDDKLNETVNHSYISFSQLLQQPVSRLASPVLRCTYDMPLAEVSARMTQNSSDFILVTAAEGETLGYISDDILRARAIPGEGGHHLKAWQVMTAPVPGIHRNATVMEALNTLKTMNTDFLVLKNDQADYTAYIHKKTLLIIQDFIPARLLSNIDNARSDNELKQIREQFVLHLLPIIENNTHPSIIFKSLSKIADLLCRKIITLTIEEMGEPPSGFAFLMLGSEG